MICLAIVWGLPSFRKRRFAITSFANTDGILITKNLINIIVENKQHLSDIDGLIGDGDHGINMSKGFEKTAERLNGDCDSLSSSFKILSTVLMDEIGGAMGPLYGSFFRAMFRASKKCDKINEKVFSEMLNAALDRVRELGQAEVGDKTLIDTLVPAVEAFDKAIAEERGFSAALDAMKSAAEKGRNSTKELVAKKGRASRLGERSKGVMDAGATSCCLILSGMADSMQELIGG